MMYLPSDVVNSPQIDDYLYVFAIPESQIPFLSIRWTHDAKTAVSVFHHASANVSFFLNDFCCIQCCYIFSHH